MEQKDLYKEADGILTESGYTAFPWITDLEQFKALSMLEVEDETKELNSLKSVENNSTSRYFSKMQVLFVVFLLTSLILTRWDKYFACLSFALVSTDVIFTAITILDTRFKNKNSISSPNDEEMVLRPG